MKKNFFLVLLLIAPLFISSTLFSADPPPPKEEKADEPKWLDVVIMGTLISDDPTFAGLKAAAPAQDAVLAAISKKDIRLISNVSEVLNVTLETETGAVVATTTIDPNMSTIEYINIENLPVGTYTIYIEKADGESGQLYGYFDKK